MVFSLSLGIYPVSAALIQFQDDFYEEIDSDGILIDANDDTSNDIQIQFGNDVSDSQNGVLEWDLAADEFILTTAAGGAERANLSFELEVVSALPGGGVGLGASGAGRIVQLDTADGTAPGCPCTPGTFVWDGTQWIDNSAAGGGGSTDLDGAYDNDVDKILNVDNASGLEFSSTVSGSIVFDLQSTGDLEIQGAGTTFALFDDGGVFELTAAEDTERIRLTDQTNADSVSIYTGTGSPDGALSAEAGSLFLDQTGVLYVNDSAGSGTDWVALDDADADTLDTLDSLQFLRSDTSDNYTSGTLTFDPGTTLDIDGNIVNLDEITNTSLTLDSDNAGAGADVDLVANQGVDNPGTLRYNATLNRWEISNDGGAFVAISTGDGDFEDVYADDGDNTLTTSNGDFTVNSGTGDVIISSNDWSVDASGNISINGATVAATLDANGAVSLGDGGDDVAIDSDDWDISSAGVASGFTGLTSTGSVNFSGTSAFRIREDADPATNAACATLGELILDSTDEQIQLCTATGGAGAATWMALDAGSLDGVDSLQFLRSDTSDTYTSGTLTFSSGTVLDIDGNIVNLDEITNNTLILDSDDTGGDVALQFGAANAEQILWDNTNGEFDLTDDLHVDGGVVVAADIDFNQNQAVELVLHQGGAFPVSPVPVEGQKFWRTDLNQEFVYNGTTWVSTSNADNNVTLYYQAQYEGAVVSPDGSDNDGILQSDRDATNFRNFYQWFSSKNSLRDVDLVLSITLPDDFSSFQATPLQFDYRTSDPDLADAQLDVTMLDTANASVPLTGATDLNNTSWTTANVTFGGSPTFTAGEDITLRFKFQARKDGSAQSIYLGPLLLNYLRQ